MAKGNEPTWVPAGASGKKEYGVMVGMTFRVGLLVGVGNTVDVMTGVLVNSTVCVGVSGAPQSPADALPPHPLVTAAVNINNANRRARKIQFMMEIIIS